MKEDKVEKMSYSAMAGELRKGARLYEVFKNASACADILGNFEKESGKAKREISALNKELEGLNSQCDESFAKKQTLEDEAAKIQLESKGLLLSAKNKSSEIIEKAKDHAERNTVEANNELILVQSSIKTAKEEAALAKNKEKDALESLAKVEKQIQTAKNKFLKTLEG